MTGANAQVEVRTYIASAQEAPTLAARGLYPSSRVRMAPSYGRLVISPIIILVIVGATLGGEGLQGAAVGAVSSILYLLLRAESRIPSASREPRPSSSRDC